MDNITETCVNELRLPRYLSRDLSDNPISILPADLFKGLTSMDLLWVYNNLVDTAT